MAGRIQTNESLKIFNGELKKRCRMEKSISYYGSPKSAIGPEEKAIRKGEITNGELWEGRPCIPIYLEPSDPATSPNQNIMNQEAP